MSESAVSALLQWLVRALLCGYILVFLLKFEIIIFLLIECPKSWFYEFLDESGYWVFDNSVHEARLWIVFFKNHHRCANLISFIYLVLIIFS